MLMGVACKRLCEPEDDNTNIARAWVNELRQMEPQQQLLAKKAINDILFEGRMGSLDRYSVQINAFPQPYVQQRFVKSESSSARSSTPTPMSTISHGSFQSNPPT